MGNRGATASAALFERLPTLQELLTRVDGDMLLGFVAKRAALAEDEAGVSSANCVRRVAGSALSRARDALPRRSMNWCFFPERAFGTDPDARVLTQEMTCALVNRMDFACAQADLAWMRPVVSRREWRERCRFGSDAGVRRVSALPLHEPSSVPWEALLGFRVWADGDFTREELVGALADIVFCAIDAEGGLVEASKEGPVRIDAACVLPMPSEPVAFDADEESERLAGMTDLACSLNYNEHIDLCRRVAALARMLADEADCDAVVEAFGSEARGETARACGDGVY